MPSRIALLTMALLFSFALSVAAGERVHLAAPSVLPGTDRFVKSPGFWISRHSSPDRVILNADEIRVFNQKLDQAGLTKDLYHIDAFDLNISQTQIQREIKKFERGHYFANDGRLIARDFFRRIKDNLAIDDMKDIVPRHAFVLRQSDQRLLPTKDVLTAEPFDVEFDEIQNSSLDAGEPLVAFYETIDHRWVYTQTAASVGWVLKENLLFVSSDEWRNILNSEHFVVVTAAKADLYRDSGRTKFYDSVRMGTKFAVNMTTEDAVEVVIAPGHHVFINRRDVNVGFLPYTPRTIIEQAFKMLNAPYGWGGVNGEQDCSAFLKGVFATVGIVLPRNSGEQGKSGTLMRNLAEAQPGITIAQMKGHIVLYLGMYENRPFAIHEAYAYRESVESVERTRVFNRVAVSDLNLGESSKKGSLLKRIIAIREVR